MDARVVDLLRRATESLDTLNVPYGIGGAFAMRAHGYSRETTDVTVFALDESRGPIIRALRGHGLTVAPVLQPFHYVAYDPAYGDPEIRIDVLFPAGEPELSGVEYAERKMIEGVNTQVFPVNLLVASKFYSDRDEDHHDIGAMLHRGIFDPSEVERLIASIDAEGAADFHTEIAAALRPRPARKRPTRKPKTCFLTARTSV